MTDKKFDPVDLDRYFAAAREHTAQPSDDLMAQVLTDAFDAQAAAAPEVPNNQPTVPWLGQILRELGGWPAMAGLTTATLAGIWLGINPPEGLSTTTDALLGSGDAAYLIDVVPGTAFDLAEGAL